MYPSRIIKNVPGETPTESKSEALRDLKSVKTIALLENMERQKKLLMNRAFIATLADKGAKIYNLIIRLEEELKRREDEEVELSTIMSGLKISGKDLSDELEWKGKCKPEVSECQLSSSENSEEDREEEDPLKILVSHSSSEQNKKKLRIRKQQIPLIKPSDNDDRSENVPNIIQDPHVINLCKKVDSNEKKNERFLPHKTLVTEGKISQRTNKKWDLSSATPPPPVYGEVKLVTLEQSVSLQLQQAKQLKEVQLKHAIERLKDKRYRIGDTFPAQNIIVYRGHVSSDGSDDVTSECEHKVTVNNIKN